MTIAPSSTGQSKASMIRSVIRRHDEEVKAGEKVSKWKMAGSVLAVGWALLGTALLFYLIMATDVARLEVGRVARLVAQAQSERVQLAEEIVKIRTAVLDMRKEVVAMQGELGALREDVGTGVYGQVGRTSARSDLTLIKTQLAGLKADLSATRAGVTVIKRRLGAK